MFVASQYQAWRSTWPSTQPKVGFACSPACVAAIGVASRNVKQRLSPRKLAYSRLNNALESGKIVRPAFCERCGRDPGLDRLGRSRIEGHHEDHSKPLEVQWLCDGCHKEVSPKARGERNAQARFTEQQVRAIKRQLQKPGVVVLYIARRYGVTHKAISDIRDGKTWRHI